jgi:exoribonuclease II
MNIDPSRQRELKEIAADVLHEHGFLPEFSPEALQQAADAAPAGLSPGIRDLRDLLWCSIDNDDSRDLDQLSVGEALPGDTYRVLVAIADVDSIVRAGSPADEHAGHNTTSLYTAAGIFPMLPERLSTHLTSLAEGEERLAMVVDMTVSGDGEILKSSLFRALVLNRAKLAYRSVAAWLEGQSPAPARLAAVPGLDAKIRLQDRVSQLLRRRRQERGALNLETRRARAVFSAGVLSDFRDEQKNRAQELIEDLMIAANQITARFLMQQGYPSLRRALPPPARWDRIVTLAAERGERLPARPDSSALNAFLVRQRELDPERFGDLSLSVLKLLGSGEYMLETPERSAEGHFGLAAEDYTHSTAPNRRFVDLVTQRLIKAALTGAPPPYSNEQLHLFAAHCTEQEKDASKIERRINKSAAALLLAPRIGEEFDAMVTGASSKGTWVRIRRPAVEGKLISRYEDVDVGDRVRVRLEGVDPSRGHIDFARAGK